MKIVKYIIAISLILLIVAITIWYYQRIRYNWVPYDYLHGIYVSLFGYGIIQIVLVFALIGILNNIKYLNVTDQYTRLLFGFLFWLGSAFIISSVGQISIGKLHLIYLGFGLIFIVGAFFLLTRITFKYYFSLLCNFSLIVLFLYTAFKYCILKRDFSGILLIPLLIISSFWVYTLSIKLKNNRLQIWIISGK